MAHGTQEKRSQHTFLSCIAPMRCSTELAIVSRSAKREQVSTGVMDEQGSTCAPTLTTFSWLGECTKEDVSCEEPSKARGPSQTQFDDNDLRKQSTPNQFHDKSNRALRGEHTKRLSFDGVTPGKICRQGRGKCGACPDPPSKSSEDYRARSHDWRG